MACNPTPELLQALNNFQQTTMYEVRCDGVNQTLVVDEKSQSVFPMDQWDWISPHGQQEEHRFGLQCLIAS